MKTEILSIPPQELLQLLSVQQPRTTGVHLSTILQDMLRRTDPGKYKASPNAEGLPIVRWEVGFIWEEIWSRAVLRRHDLLNTQVEMEFEGIYLTPDGVDFAGQELWEFKCTWKKSTVDPSRDLKFWSWFVQMMAYCHALGIRKARLVVIFVNGDYRNSGPIVGQWRYTFTKAELERNWRMLMEHRALMEEEAK